MLIDDEVGLTDLHLRGGGWKEGMEVGFFVIVFSLLMMGGKDGGMGRCIRLALDPLAGAMVEFYDVDDNDLDTGDSSRE